MNSEADNVARACPAPCDIYIIHLEDEPARNSGFARELGPKLGATLAQLGVVYDYIVEDENDERDLVFEIFYREKSTNRQFKVIYKFVENEKDWQELCGTLRDAQVRVVIFDVFVGSPSAGTKLYRELGSQWSGAQKIFYTAYAGVVVKDLGWNREDRRLMEKPHERERVLKLMIDSIYEYMRPQTQAR